MPRQQYLVAALIATTLSLVVSGASSSPHAVDVSPEDIELPGEIQETKGQRVYSPFVGRDYPDQNSFYYVRVLEIPTPRWTTYDAAFFSVDRPDNAPATVQDRTYTSPVWHSSEG